MAAAETTTAVLTPLVESEAIDLGNHYWRKQVLRHGDFAYKAQGVDRTLKFTPEYTQALARAYREKAYDAVPFQFAGPDNAHTNAIEATRGEIVGFDATPEGLDAIFALEPEAEKVISRHPKLPVSVRIIENLERADKKAWPAAVQHVLATWDPRVTAMKPWERVELSNDGVDSVLDLTDSTAVAPPGPDTEGATMPEIKDQLTEDEVTALRALLTKATPPAPKTDADGWTMPSDEELQRIADALLAEEEATPEAAAAVTTPAPAPAAAAETAEPALVAASNEPSPEAIEMAARMDRLEKDNTRLRIEADQKAYLDLRRTLADESGIPPAVTDLAKPLLVGSHSVELSNGSKVDAGEIVRKVLTSIGEHVKLLDLSGPTVFDAGQEESERQKAAGNTEWAKQYLIDQGVH
jgi:hypothetical protein